MSTQRELDNRVVTIDCRGGEDFPRVIFGSCDGRGVVIVADALREIIALAGWKIGDPRIEVEVRADLGWNTGTDDQCRRNPYKLSRAAQVIGLNVPYFKHLTDRARDLLTVVINEIACGAKPDAPCVLAIEAHVNSQGISRTLNPQKWDEAYVEASRRVRDYRLEIIGANLPEAIATQMPAIKEFLDRELSRLDIPALLNPPAADEELEEEPEIEFGTECDTPFPWDLPSDQAVHPHEDLTEGAERMLSAFAHQTGHQPAELEVIDLRGANTPEQMADAAVRIGRALGTCEPTPEEERVSAAVEVAVELHDGVEDTGRKTTKRGNGHGSEAEPA